MAASELGAIAITESNPITAVETTQIYLDADLALKEQALKKATPIEVKELRFRPADQLLSFLKSL